MSITTVSWRIPFKMEMQHHKEWNIQKQNRPPNETPSLNRKSLPPKESKTTESPTAMLVILSSATSPDAHQELHTCCASPLWNTPAACRENAVHSNRVWRPSFSILSTLKTWDWNIWYHGKSKLLEISIPSHMPFILNFQNSYENIWKRVGKVPMFISCDLSANANKI